MPDPAEMTTRIATSPREDVALKHREQLVQSHLRLQLIATRLAVPIAIIAFVVQFALDTCWQNLALLLGFVAMSVAWVLGLLLTRRGALDRALTLFASSVLGFEGLAMLVLEENSASALLACTIVVVYTSLFSRRALILTAAGTFALFTLAELVRLLEPYQMKPFSPTERFLFEVGFAALLIPLASIVLVHSHRIKDGLLGDRKSVV